MNIRDVLKKIANGQSLTEEESFECFSSLFDGNIELPQAGAFLFGLKIKKEAPSELTGAVKAALKRANLVEINNGKTIDTCGTGGDGKNSFNCSTAVALFLADMGYKVVKHGNRAISSKCGSADILEKLNIPFPKTKADVESMLNKYNFAFLFAPFFHPSFKNVAPIRKSLGVPTIFNLMGPLLNPARPKYQLVGVADENMINTIAHVLKGLGVEKAAVVHGAEGFDEISPCGTSKILFIDKEKIESSFIDPRDFDMELADPKDLVCNSEEESLKVMKEILTGKAPSAIKNMVSLNLGVCLFLLEKDVSLKECIEEAKKRVGQGVKTLKGLVTC